jgi:two-component system NtrC family sensor kinase
LKTSAELVKNVNFQSSLIENSIDGILGCDENQIIVTYNRSMEKLLGYPKTQVLKKMKPMALFKPALFLKLKKDLSNKNFGGKNKLFVYETAMLSISKEDIPVQISGFIFTQDTVQNNMVLFIRDLRHLKTLEQKVTDQAKLLHREKMISLGRLAASMVHEINNPLSGILNYIRLMIRISGKGKCLTPVPPSDLIQDQVNRFNSYLEIIESETQRCSDLVSGLLKFLRKTKLEQKRIDIADMVRHSLLLCNHKLELSNIVLRLRCDPDVPCVYGDFNQLEQCMINLIFNAIDAMDETDAMDADKNLDIRTGYNPEENLVFISIKDTGKGISKEDLPLIFEPFFTTKTKGYGVGLGLSSAYGIIEKHRGTIVVERHLKGGSEFIIKLPPKER